jgi:hypothetical protein
MVCDLVFMASVRQMPETSRGEWLFAGPLHGRLGAFCCNLLLSLVMSRIKKHVI